MDDDAADAAGFGEAHVLPGLAGVGGLVDAVAHDVARTDHPRLAGAGPHDVRIGRRERQRANRLHRLVVEHRLERRAAVGGFPDAARGGAEVVRRRIAGNADRGRDAPGRRRAHVAEAQRIDRQRLRCAAPAAASLFDGCGHVAAAPPRADGRGSAREQAMDSGSATARTATSQRTGNRTAGMTTSGAVSRVYYWRP